MGSNQSFYKKYYRPKQKISKILKYLMFFVNLIFWLCGLACTGLGAYLYVNDFRPVIEALDVFMNPALLLLIAGAIIFSVSFLGCAGSLRDNVCMLRAFAFSIFFCYVSLVILAFVVFIFFYSDTKTGVSIQTVLQNAVRKYHESKNMAEVMDLLQKNLNCCGAGSLGYKDWAENGLYNCSAANAAPERCGVPFSCCRPRTGSGPGHRPATGASASSPDVFCGFGAQEKPISEVQNAIYIEGCLQPLQKAFEGHAVIVGAIMGAIIVPVCLSVTLTNILARQIEHQRYLLAKEARRDERRRRRERSKCRLAEGAFSINHQVAPPEVVVQRMSYTHLPTAAPPSDRLDQVSAVIVNVQASPGSVADNWTSLENDSRSRKASGPDNLHDDKRRKRRKRRTRSQERLSDQDEPNSAVQGAFSQHDYVDIERATRASRCDKRLAKQSDKRRYSVAQF